MADGSHVVQRCLRCGAIFDEPAFEVADAAPDVVSPRRPEPQPSNLPPARAEHEAQPAARGAERGDLETDEESAHAALSALRELGELHAAGVLTDREFARKKAELLRRV
jgi:hypothetical protein